MDINVRRMELADAPIVSDLWNKLTKDQLKRDKYYIEYNDCIQECDMSDYFRDCLKKDNCCILVILVDGRIVGFSETWLNKADFYFNITDYAYILHFYIEEDVRSHIVASRLFKETEKWALEHNSKFLGADVFAFNSKVQKLLEYENLSKYKIRYMKELKNGEI